MLEIIALIWLTGQMGKLAERKGERSGKWKLFTVLAWIGGEIIGAVVAVAAFQKEDYISMLPMAILGAVGGYLLVRFILSRMPDKPTDQFDFENHDR